MEQVITMERAEDFLRYLQSEERSGSTLAKYTRELRAFTAWLDGGPVTREAVIAWKEKLLEEGRTPATVNSMLSSVNGLLKFLGRGDCCVRYFHIQRRTFRESSRELTREEYLRLLAAAEARSRRLGLIMETICATGIRVSELHYITVEAARAGRADIRLKGKIRTILLPAKLCRKLLKYAGNKKTASGEVFLTRSGKPLTRRQIWAEMKALCGAAGVEPSKVFPHNLRHLFAVAFYRACRDIVRLSDVLGHSSIEVTRIYLMTSGEEHRRTMEGLGLVS